MHGSINGKSRRVRSPEFPLNQELQIFLSSRESIDIDCYYRRQQRCPACSASQRKIANHERRANNAERGRCRDETRLAQAEEARMAAETNSSRLLTYVRDRGRRMRI